MKRVMNKFRFLLYAFLLTGITSCSRDSESLPIPGPEGNGMPFAFSLAQQTAPSTPLNYALYIFSRNATEEYQLDSIIPALDEQTRLKFPNQPAGGKNYRFLFLASPSAQQEIAVVSATDTPVARGTVWKDIRIKPSTGLLSIDNYYDVVNMSSDDILKTDTIQGHLSRMVGQMIFQFSKVGSSINDIVPIDLSAVTSVFDRIYHIEITYENYTNLLSFDEAGELQPAGTATEPLTQSIVTTPDERLGIPLPQSSLDLIDNDRQKGGRILGYYLLPNENHIQVSLSFGYYDTTPIGSETTTPVTNRYDKRTLQLHLPQSTSSGLSVFKNAYTVNKAGIHCNRIIDIETTHGLDINTEWKKNQEL